MSLFKEGIVLLLNSVRFALLPSDMFFSVDIVAPPLDLARASRDDNRRAPGGLSGPERAVPKEPIHLCTAFCRKTCISGQSHVPFYCIYLDFGLVCTHRQPL